MSAVFAVTRRASPGFLAEMFSPANRGSSRSSPCWLVQRGREDEGTTELQPA